MTVRARKVSPVRWVASAASLSFAALLVALVALPGFAAHVAEQQPASVVHAAAPSPGGDPIIVVLDLSGSMNEDDGTGTVKLQGAQSALESLIRANVDTVPVGVWVYPSDSNCGAGSWVVEPGRVHNPVDVLAKVDALGADGGTPTADALRQAAQEMRASGYAKGTIVLISDGESNCSDDPCAAAAEIAATGIDVTVNTVGFRQSDAGREELSCISSATGGQYFDAEDSDGLAKYVNELTRPVLDVRLDYENPAPAGVPTAITVSVTNTTGIEARDVRASLAFDNVGAASIFPAAIPPVVAIGNVPGNATVSYSWTVNTGANSDATTAGFHTLVTGTNVTPVRADGSFAVVDTNSFTDAGPVLSAALDEFPLLILGDSYSAGEGAYAYADATPGAEARCHRSDLTYLVPYISTHGGDVVNLACSGAETQHLADMQEGTDPQLDQILAMDTPPGAVVMTFGGNDIGFGPILTKCVVGPGCHFLFGWADEWRTTIVDLPNSLTPAYLSVWDAVNSPESIDARDGELAPIVVLGYPQLFHEYTYGRCASDFTTEHTISASEIRLLNELGALLNSSIRTAVDRARAQGVEIYYVPDTRFSFLPDHTVCDGDDAFAWGIQGNPFSADIESFHPKVDGYAAIEGEILRWARGHEREPVMNPRTPDQAVSSAFIEVVRQPAFLTLAPTGIAQTGNWIQGSTIQVQGSGYLPGSPVILQLHSEPTVLGSFVADESGNIAGELRIPVGVTTGQHQVIALGLTLEYDVRRDAADVVIMEPLPRLLNSWVLGALASVVVAIGLAVWALVAWTRETRARRTARRSAGSEQETEQEAAPEEELAEPSES